MATSSLPKKLQLKAGQRAVIINAPAGYLDELGPLPEGVHLAERPEGQVDFIVLFFMMVTSEEETTLSFPA